MRAVLLGLVIASSALPLAAHAVSGGVGRPSYHGSCDLPKAGWNEEILRVRDRAAAECKVNLLLRSSDRTAPISTEAQDQFWTLKTRHDELVRSAR